jgi:NTP pyrophosphatase (non-canonical NTP hydrolase)
MFYDLDTYQDKAWRFAKDTAKNTKYLVPGLAGEVGEVSSLFAKCVRDGGTVDEEKLTKELGDVLWFVAGIATYHSISLADIAEGNIHKLEGRKARGTIGGSGDVR